MTQLISEATDLLDVECIERLEVLKQHLLEQMNASKKEFYTRFDSIEK